MRWELPRAFLLSLVFIFVIELFVCTFFSRFATNPTYAKLGAKIKIARREGLNQDLLILGDSTSAASLNAEALQKNTGLSTFNFSLIDNATYAGYYFVLQDYLRSNRPPRYIILMNAYKVWGLDYSGGKSKLLMMIFPERTLDLLSHPEFTDCPGDILKNIVKWLLPSQRYKYEIRRLLESRNFLEYLRVAFHKEKELTEEVLRQKGTSFFQEAPLVANLREQRKFVKNTPFRITRLNDYYLNKFLNETREKNIKVFICFPPLLKEFYEEEKDTEYFRSYKLFMEKIVSSHSHTLFLTDDFYPVLIEELSNAIYHVNTKGQDNFTRMISQRILELIQ